MTTRRFMLATAAAACLGFALPSFADDMVHSEGMHAHNAYARTTGGIGKTGAIYFMLHNNYDADDRLVEARADIAKRVELHTHHEDANGVMQMLFLEDGIALPAGEMHELARGGDHVMLMGLTRDLKDGDTFPLTLVFEHAPEMAIEVTVDNARKPGEAGAGGMDHDMGHDMGHGTEHGESDDDAKK